MRKAAECYGTTRADLPRLFDAAKGGRGDCRGRREPGQNDNGAENTILPTDGEGHDVASLDLTGVQEDLIQAVEETGTPTVVVLINGRPLSTRWTAEHVPAIVEAWEPGERGGEAVADVLFGDYNPSGRLAISIPRQLGPIAGLLQLQAVQGVLDQK